MRAWIMRISLGVVVAVIGATIVLAGQSKSDTIQIGKDDDIITYISKYDATKDELYSRDSNPEMYCLAENIYFESRDDNYAGQTAVADVVLNRVHSDKYPNTICEVVRQGEVRESWKTKQTPDPNDAVYVPIRNRCQFSWYCDGKPEDIRNKDAWRKAQEIAYRMIQHNQYVGITEGATHYHATYVDPKWNRDMQLVGRIGAHIFYRQP